MLFLKEFNMFFSAAIGVGFYGNEEAHKGLQQFSNAADDVHTTISNMKSQVSDQTYVELWENVTDFSSFKGTHNPPNWNWRNYHAC